MPIEIGGNMPIWNVEIRRSIFGIPVYIKRYETPYYVEADVRFKTTVEDLGMIGRMQIPFVFRTEIRLFRYGNGWNHPHLKYG